MSHERDRESWRAVEFLLDQMRMEGQVGAVCAREQILGMGERAVGPLIAEIEDATGARRRRALSPGRWWLVGIALLVGGLLAESALSPIASFAVASAAVLILIILLLVDLRPSIWRPDENRALHDVISLLVELDDVRGLGALIEAADNGDVYDSVAPALVRLLPRLSSATAARLSPRQSDALCRMTHSGSYDVRVAALEAVARTGDASALPALRHAAQHRGHRRGASQLQATAIRCLEQLRERLAADEANRTLMRPAEAPGEPCQALLRPLSGPPAQDPKCLLRPVAGPHAGKVPQQAGIGARSGEASC